MSKVGRHLKQNVIAYLALFVALGGTSYAAISLPRNAVGAKQIRNHSIDPVKLDRNAFGGYVRLWARVDANGNLIASSPKAKVVVWYPSGSQFFGGQLHWSTAVARNCFAVASTESVPTASYASAKLVTGSRQFGTDVAVALSGLDATNVEIVCPQP